MMAIPIPVAYPIGYFYDPKKKSYQLYGQILWTPFMNAPFYQCNPGVPVKHQEHGKLALTIAKQKDTYTKFHSMKLTWDSLHKNSYPLIIDSVSNRVHIEPNQFTKGKQALKTGDRKRECVRCRKQFFLDNQGKVPVLSKSCIYHQRGSNNGVKGPTTVCCDKPLYHSKGCTTSDVHVFDDMEEEDFLKFIKTPKADGPDDCRSLNVFALDCEMAYTNKGLALVKVSVVDSDGQLILDQIVRPDAQLLCANTKYSGVTAEEINESSETLESVQKTLFRLINEETILIGHSLESDLKALKLVHTNVIDTAVICMDNGNKPSLRSLMLTHFGKKIQQNKGPGETHNSIEDATSCIELVKKFMVVEKK